MATYTREQWGSQFDRGGYVIGGPVGEAYVHHFNSGITAPQTLAESMARVRAAQRYHAETQGWGDIGYSWLVDDLGNIFEGRGWFRTGAHTYLFNSKGYGICWLGDSNVSQPSAAALEAIARCVRMGVDAGALISQPTIVAHRDRVPDTSCCGTPMYLQLDRIRQLFAGATPSPNPTPPTLTPYTEDDGMLVRKTNGGDFVLIDGLDVRVVPMDDLGWPVVNAGLIELVRSGVIPGNPDGSPAVPVLGDNALKLIESVQG